MSRLAAAARSISHQPGFVGVLAANFALGMAYSFVVPFMSMWGTLHIGMSAPMFGVFMMVTSLCAVTVSILLARWSDTHVPRRTMLIAGGLGGIFGYLGYAFLENIAVLLVTGSLLLGVASVSFSQLFAHVRDELSRPENEHLDAAFLTSILRVSFSVAWMAGPAIGAWVMVHHGYRGVFIGAAGLFALFLIGVLVFVPHRSHPPAARSATGTSLFQVLTRGDILANFAGFVLLFAAFSINMMNLPLMVTQELGGTGGQVGKIFVVAPVFEVPLMIWFGYLAARGHQLALIRFGVLVGALYFAVLMLAQAPWHIYPMQILSAISIAITTNITITFFQELLPGQAGIATSIYSNSFSTGSLIGYFGFGMMVESFGHRGVFAACSVLSLITFSILLAYGRWRSRVPAALATG